MDNSAISRLDMKDVSGIKLLLRSMYMPAVTMMSPVYAW